MVSKNNNIISKQVVVNTGRLINEMIVEFLNSSYLKNWTGESENDVHKIVC